MILELRALLRCHRQLPLKDLASRLQIDAEVARAMLHRLMKKGLVVKLPQDTLCAGGCRLCPSESVEIYRWIGDDSGQPAPLPRSASNSSQCTTGCLETDAR